MNDSFYEDEPKAKTPQGFWGQNVVPIFRIFIGLYILCTAIAMKLYPGGTAIDHTTLGHRFWLNYLCDLSQPIGLNGLRNPGAFFGQAALFIFALLTALFWWLLPLMLGPFGLRGKVVRLFGVMSACFAVLMPLTPSEKFGIIHSITIGFSAIPALLAFGIAWGPLVDIKRNGRWFCYAAWIVLLLTIVQVLCFIYNNFLTHGAIDWFLPGLQKVWMICLLVWAYAVSHLVINRPILDERHAY